MLFILERGRELFRCTSKLSQRYDLDKTDNKYDNLLKSVKNTSNCKDSKYVPVEVIYWMPGFKVYKGRQLKIIMAINYQHFLIIYYY